jgi:hypothetical protein
LAKNDEGARKGIFLCQLDYTPGKNLTGKSPTFFFLEFARVVRLAQKQFTSEPLFFFSTPPRAQSELLATTTYNFLRSSSLTPAFKRPKPI